MPNRAPKSQTHAEREAAKRLAREAEALRANLHRRKAQTRARATAAPKKAADECP